MNEIGKMGDPQTFWMEGMNQEVETKEILAPSM